MAMIRYGWQWLAVVGSDWQWLAVIGSDWQWLAVVGSDWQWLAVVDDVSNHFSLSSRCSRVLMITWLVSFNI
jgi:hypothetical protein